MRRTGTEPGRDVAEALTAFDMLYDRARSGGVTSGDLAQLAEIYFAVRTAASVARALAGAEWRIGLRELRGWPARVQPGESVGPVEIELPRARASRIPINLDGLRLPLGATAVVVKLV